MHDLRSNGKAVKGPSAVLISSTSMRVKVCLGLVNGTVLLLVEPWKADSCSTARISRLKVFHHVCICVWSPNAATVAGQYWAWPRNDVPF